MLSTFIKLPFSIKTLFCIFLSGPLTQVLLYPVVQYAQLYMPYIRLFETQNNNLVILLDVITSHLCDH